MLYDKKIKYIEYFVDNEKKGTVGYVRIERIDDITHILISVRDLPIKFETRYKVYIRFNDNESVLGEITILNGCGELNVDNRTPYAEGEIQEIYIILDDRRCLKAYTGEKIIKKGPAREESARGESAREESARKEPIMEELVMEEHIKKEAFRNENEDEQYIDSDTKVTTKNLNEKNTVIQECDLREHDAQQNNAQQQKIQQNNTRRGNNREQNTKEQNKDYMLESKWEQLSALYPHIKPFHDEREYLSLKPRDFVIFRDRYYELIKNSFLLHGYYNYGHIILKKEQYGDMEKYYVGVPGTYFDREKQVAVMFGFENFEGKNDSAMQGDYGYYLIPTEI